MASKYSIDHQLISRYTAMAPENRVHRGEARELNRLPVVMLHQAACRSGQAATAVVIKKRPATVSGSSFGTGVRRRVAGLERERPQRTDQRPSAAQTYHLGRCPRIRPSRFQSIIPGARPRGP